MLEKVAWKRSLAGRGFTQPMSLLSFLQLPPLFFSLNPKLLTEGRLAPAQEAVQGATDCEGQVGPLDLPDLGGEAAGHDRG